MLIPLRLLEKVMRLSFLKWLTKWRTTSSVIPWASDKWALMSVCELKLAWQWRQEKPVNCGCAVTGPVLPWPLAWTRLGCRERM